MKKKTALALVIIVQVIFLTTIAVNLFFGEDSEPVINKIVYDINVLERTKDVNYMYGVATAYCPSAGGINTDGWPEYTATMKPAKEGIIAVNTDIIPYGSEVMIIHNKTVIRGQAWDTGGAMRKNPKQVDILMEDYQKAIEWGRREVHIIWW